MSAPFMSRLPPSCGVVSSTTLLIALDEARPAITALLVIFFNPPPDVSIARNTSSFAAVDISDNELTATELKFVPSAIKRLLAVFVPIVISSPDTVKSPVTITFCENVVLPFDAIVIASTSEAEPIVPPSFIIKSSTNVTIPPELIVIAPAAEAEPIVPPSLINISSTKVTIPVDAIDIADVLDQYRIVQTS